MLSVSFHAILFNLGFKTLKIFSIVLVDLILSPKILSFFSLFLHYCINCFYSHFIQTSLRDLLFGMSRNGHRRPVFLCKSRRVHPLNGSTRLISICISIPNPHDEIRWWRKQAFARILRVSFTLDMAPARLPTFFFSSEPSSASHGHPQRVRHRCNSIRVVIEYHLISQSRGRSDRVITRQKVGA